MDAQLPDACRGTVRFLLAGEISNIYKRDGQTRKVHNVVFAPDLDAVARLQAKLETIGNIRSDGRPILGLDSRDLLEIMLEIDERCHLIPAHIWTPWFSMLGSKSGFDSVEACFADLTPHIFALETGLSSDPPMNWRVSNLDPYTLVSHSDAHSPPKLAREATLFDIDLSYPALFAALKSGDPARFKGTLEFFPEEGKYHLDGHRKCNVCWEPPTTRAHAGLCSVCGKPVTVGVSHRVEELADRPPNGRPARTHPFESLIPLPEILSEIAGVGPNSKTVQREYIAPPGRPRPRTRHPAHPAPGRHRPLRRPAPGPRHRPHAPGRRPRPRRLRRRIRHHQSLRRHRCHHPRRADWFSFGKNQDRRGPQKWKRGA